MTIIKKRGKQTGERIVPIYRKVIGSGFLDYVQHQKKGDVNLFPTLSNCDRKGRYIQAGITVSAWFNEDDKKTTKTLFYKSRHQEQEKFSTILIQTLSRNFFDQSFRRSIMIKLEEINSWSSKSAAGAFASPLKLTVGGQRSPSIVFSGVHGLYWSSTTNGVFANCLHFHDTNGSLAEEAIIYKIPR